MVFLGVLALAALISGIYYNPPDNEEGATRIIKKLMDENDSLRHIIEDMPIQQSISKDSLKFEVDFKALKAFSIERFKGRETIIGYYDKDEKICQ